MATTNNYVIGRGKLYFDKFDDSGAASGERYLGNTPALSMTSAYQNLDHYTSDEGQRIKDDSAQLQIDRTGSFQCDNITMENVALVFGNADPVDETATTSTGLSETFVVNTDRFYQLGTNVAADGVGNVSNVVITDNTGIRAYGDITFTGNPAAADTVTINGNAITFVSGTPSTHEVQIGGDLLITAQRLIAEINAYPALYAVTAAGTEDVVSVRAIATGTGGNALTLAESSTALTVSGATLSGGSASGVIGATGNYEVDAANGRIHVLADAVDLADGDSIEVQYDRGISTRTLVIDQNNQVEGALRFIADNAKGRNKNYFWPRVKLTPNGEYALKGETWQVMTFNFEVLQPADGVTKRVYVREAA